MTVPALPLSLCPCRYKLWAIGSFSFLITLCTAAAMLGLMRFVDDMGYTVVIALGCFAALALAILMTASYMLLTRRATVIFDPLGVRVNPLTGRSQSIAWEEITQIEITGKNHYSTLVLQGPTEIVINCHLMGEPASELQRWVTAWRSQYAPPLAAG